MQRSASGRVARRRCAGASAVLVLVLSGCGLDLDSGAEHTGFLTGELIDDFAISGPPERCLEKIAVLAEAGVDEVSTAYLNGQVTQMERVGREIMPALPGRVEASESRGGRA